MDLLNQVWRDLNNTKIWKKAPDSIRSLYREHYSNYRRILPQARPFNLSNRALEVALEMSMDGPNKMAERLFMARLPFPKVWIELDFHERVRIGERLGIAGPLDESAPKRLGWLLQEDPVDQNRWSAITWASVDNNSPVHVPHQGEMLTSPSTVAWLVDTANENPPEKVGMVNGIDKSFLDGYVEISDSADEKIGKEAWRSFAHLGWGWKAASLSESTISSFYDPMRQLTVAPQLQNSINVGWEPLSYQIWKQNLATSDIRNQYVTTAVESRGDVRLLVTLLALINEVPTIETPYEKKGSFTGSGGAIRRYLTNKTVTINIPSRKPLRQIRSLFSKKIKSRKARHEVRGHWRTIVHKHDHWRKETLPDGTIDRIFISKGQVERVWINSHERGDAGVGYVKHDYQVEKK